jgi:phage-related protein
VSYIVKTRDDFLLDGVSALTYGLAVEMPQPVPPAKQRYSTWSTGDTDISEPDDSFEDVRYTLTARRIKSPEEFRNSDLYAALATARSLQLTRNSGRYYRISRLMDVQPVASYHGNEIAYKITFMLSPFAYHNDNPEVTPENNNIVNPGTRYSRPIYTLTETGNSGECSISVNGQTLNVTFPPVAYRPRAVTIDAQRMIAYNTDTGENCTRFTYGLFPFLAPGDNAIVASGCAVTVKGNWRDY